MLSTLPWKRWPLHVRIFSEEAWDRWREVDGNVGEGDEVLEQVTTGKGKGKAKRGTMTKLPLPPHPLSQETDVTLDLGGVDGKTLRRRESTKGVISRVGPIEVEDEMFRGEVWRKWAGDEEGMGMRDALANDEKARRCEVCKEEIDVDVS